MNFYCAIIQRFSPSFTYDFLIIEDDVCYASRERYSHAKEAISHMNSRRNMVRIPPELLQRILNQCDVLYESKEPFTMKEVLENKPEILL